MLYIRGRMQIHLKGPMTTIALVDDDRNILSSLSMALEAEGFHVRTYSDGVTALTNMQCSDGGWGWFSGFGERSWPHTTAVVVHGLQERREGGQDRLGWREIKVGCSGFVRTM